MPRTNSNKNDAPSHTTSLSVPWDAKSSFQTGQSESRLSLQASENPTTPVSPPEPKPVKRTPFVFPDNTPNLFWGEKLKLVVSAFQYFGLIHAMMNDSWPTVLLRQTTFVGIVNVDVVTALYRRTKNGEVRNYLFFATVLISVPLVLTLIYFATKRICQKLNERDHQQYGVSIIPMSAKQNESLLKLQTVIMVLMDFLFLPIGIACAKIIDCVETRKIIR